MPTTNRKYIVFIYIKILIKVLFLVFDFDVNEYINIEELICIIGNCIAGFCKMSNQVTPPYKIME